MWRLLGSFQDFSPFFPSVCSASRFAFHSWNSRWPSSVSQQAMMSGRMHRAMDSMMCCGISELFTGFFLRAKFSNFPPVQYEIFKVRLVCAYKRGRWQTSFLMWDYLIPGWIYAVPPSKNLRNENADTCQSIAFLCLHIFILLCTNIIPKATNTVKGITG